jgi:hypothetical protein
VFQVVSVVFFWQLVLCSVCVSVLCFCYDYKYRVGCVDAGGMNCAACEHTGGGQATAAFVLLFGSRDVHAEWKRLEKRAAETHVPGATSYCILCRRCTWISCSRDAVEAMISHEVAFVEMSQLISAMKDPSL